MMKHINTFDVLGVVLTSNELKSLKDKYFNDILNIDEKIDFKKGGVNVPDTNYKIIRFKIINSGYFILNKDHSLVYPNVYDGYVYYLTLRQSEFNITFTPIVTHIYDYLDNKLLYNENLCDIYYSITTDYVKYLVNNSFMNMGLSNLSSKTSRILFELFIDDQKNNTEFKDKYKEELITWYNFLADNNLRLDSSRDDQFVILYEENNI